MSRTYPAVALDTNTHVEKTPRKIEFDAIGRRVTPFTAEELREAEDYEGIIGLLGGIFGIGVFVYYRLCLHKRWLAHARVKPFPKKRPPGAIRTKVHLAMNSIKSRLDIWLG